ncbi:uncharacterized protein LOC101171023 isoform X1 [Oryzias latipes]|uniref:PICALM interacting mitotic regulator n=2 Tax=Oryzias latipes TaxID=8090 RepID=A0A3B3H8V9_ORYLA|nr:uncharacterized protein LOC101171023 isoform X1 [Oryzias latipes]
MSKDVMTSACVHSTEGVTAAAKFKQESSASSDNKPIERVVFSAAVMDGVGRAVVGVWRAHTVLDESDDAENSPEAPDRFRKLRSSSSLNSLRMSLRKRLPLRSVQTGSLPENPTWESLKNQPKPNPVSKFTRSARNSFTGMYQRLQKKREFSREECLVATPGQEGDNACSSNYCTPSRTPGRATTVRRTPRSAATPRRTPTSKGQKTPEGSIRGVKTGGGRRQLVRMAALRSPYASPNTQSQRLKFDQDLESVSNGLSRLQRLSKAFDDIMGKRDGPALKKRSGGADEEVGPQRETQPLERLTPSLKPLGRRG